MTADGQLRQAAAVEPAPANWRLEMRDGDRWIPVGVPCQSREEAERLLWLRGGTGLTYRIVGPSEDAR